MKRILILTLLCLLLFSCAAPAKGELRVEDLHAICELATVKCYYNTVAQITKTKENIFQRDRNMWIEYEGEAVLGIDLSALVITLEGQTVSITLPKAKLLSLHPVKETLNEKSYVCSSDGFFFKNPITAEDQELAISKGQEEMEQAILDNPALFARAENKARELLENYVERMSRLVGKEYAVVWKEA